MKIAVLTDTSAYVNPEYLKKDNLFWVPLKVVNGMETFDDTQDNFDKYNLKELIDKSSPVKTSMIPAGELEELYDKILKDFDIIFHMPIPENLSSMYNISYVTSQKDEYKGKVFTFKHYIAAAQLGEFCGWLADKVKREVNYTSVDVEKNIAEWSEKASTYIVPSDIARLANSGRATLLLKFLKMLKTLVCIKWEAKPVKFAFSTKITNIISKILDIYISKKTVDKNKFFIQLPFYMNKEEDKLARLILKTFSESNIEYEIVPTQQVYIIHAGTKSIGITIVEKELYNK